MHNLIKSRALFEILKSPVQDLDFLKKSQGENEGNAGEQTSASTVKLNANAQEFVPRFIREESTKDEAEVGSNEIKKTFEALDEHKTKTNLMLPWKGFPKKAEKSSRSAQVVLLNDIDYMILPSIKRTKKSKDEKLIADMVQHSKPNENLPTTSSNILPDHPTVKQMYDAQEKRREHERNVAVEALKLVEQRRMRAPLVSPTPANENLNNVQPVINLSRSPIKFSPEERIRVDRLRIAKRERIERVLREMTNEKQEQLDQLEPQQLQQQKKIRYEPIERNRHISIQRESEKEEHKMTSYDPNNTNRYISIPKAPEKKEEVALVVKKRYIPTTKEWDEQCRAKQMAKMEAEKQDSNPLPTSSQALSVNPNVVKITSSGVIRLGDLRATVKPRYCPPDELLETEKRKGNLTHFLPLANWTSRQNPQTSLKILTNQKGEIVKRYSIEQLLEFEPQPEELENPTLDEAILRLGFLCI
ncbi:uncharacterized protein LOC108042358 [Drosophila rhopaloa]|uniref:Uncharacterized protein n=1 Tax=Drosophila rhopaloa TaxID=1041015 RepID=A0ABM5H837_DRORH|nr:uncharacterized protein LOC108042358 [Drosophila rhopaloa]